MYTVVVYTLPDVIKRLNLQRVGDRLLLIPTQTTDPLEKHDDRLIKKEILEHFLPVLESVPKYLDVRFALESDIEDGEIIEFRGNPIKIGIFSHSYDVVECRLVVEAAFVKVNI